MNIMNRTETNFILDQMIDTFYRTDMDGVITIASASVKTLLGYTAEEMLGTKLDDYYVDREGRQEFLKKLDQEKGRIVNYTSLLRHENGGEVWVAANASYYFDQQGRVAGVEGIARDITLQKQLEDEAVSQSRELEKRIEKRTMSLQMANKLLETEIKEKQKVENALQENVLLLSKSQEIAHIGSWELDLVTNHLTWSDEVYRIFGVEPQEFQATYVAFLDAVHPSDRVKVDNSYTDSLQENITGYELDHRIIRRDNGEVRYVNEKCIHFRDNKNKIIRSIGMVLDVTDRKEIEIKLTEKTILLDNILRNANEMAIATTDLDFRITYYNPMAEHLFGHTAETVVGKTVQEIHIQEDVAADRFDRAIEQVRQTGEYRYSLEQKRENGIRYLESRIAGIYSPQGELTGYSLFSRDISKQKEQEANLKAFNTSLQSMVDEQVAEIKKREQQLSRAYGDLNQIFNIAVPLCLVSKGCKITRVNQAFCDYFQVTREDIVGKNGFDFWGCDRFETKNCFLHQLQGEENLCQRHLNKTINSKQFFCSIHSVPHRNATGDLTGMVTTFFDMTDYKKAQDALLETQKQLRQAEKLSAIGTLSGSIAHEFNNPLCGVRNVMERINRNNNFNAADQNLITLALDECERMKRLIQDLQSFNRPTNNLREKIDLHRIIETILFFMKTEWKIKQISIVKEYSDAIPAIYAVEDQLKQVLLNVIKNAGEAIRESEGVVTISTSQKGQSVLIKIHDSGSGIKEELKAHIFEPFFTTKSAVKGTGLGLSVSYGIIQSHGGDIRVESEPGKGTSFTISLPIEEQI